MFKRYKKKSQVQEMFFYILALFVIGLILFLGIKYIGVILDHFKTVDVLEFRTSLVNDVDVISVKHGSWEKFSYNVPQEVSKICFFTVDGKFPKHPYSSIDQCSELEDLDEIMCDIWISGTENVISIPQIKTPTPINLTNMVVAEKDGKETLYGYKCFSLQDGKLNIKLTGTGNGVKVSEY